VCVNIIWQLQMFYNFDTITVDNRKYATQKASSQPDVSLTPFCQSCCTRGDTAVDVSAPFRCAELFRESPTKWNPRLSGKPILYCCSRTHGHTGQSHPGHTHTNRHQTDISTFNTRNLYYSYI